MARNAAGKLLSGLVVGAVVGASVALVLSSRADITLPGKAARGANGPTPFEPANQVIARARLFVQEVRVQVQAAIDEGKKTAASTRQELTQRFEEAKRGETT